MQELVKRSGGYRDRRVQGHPLKSQKSIQHTNGPVLQGRMKTTKSSQDHLSVIPMMYVSCIRITNDNFHRTQRLREEVHRDRRHPHLYGQCAQDAPYVCRDTSKITSLMATCLSLTYHPVYPHHLSAMTARPLRRSSKHLRRIFDRILSRHTPINSVYSDDTHTRRPGSPSTRRRWSSYVTRHCWKIGQFPSIRSRYTRYRTVCPPTPLRHFLT